MLLSPIEAAARMQRTLRSWVSAKSAGLIMVSAILTCTAYAAYWDVLVIPCQGLL